MKKTAFLSILLCLLFGLSIVSSAAVVEPVEPLWDNISNLNLFMSFDETAGAACGATVSKLADEIRGTLKVYKQNSSGSWILMDMVYETTTDWDLTLAIEFDAVSGGYYKAVFTVTAIKNGVSETVTKTAYRTCE